MEIIHIIFYTIQALFSNDLDKLNRRLMFVETYYESYFTANGFQINYWLFIKLYKFILSCKKTKKQ